MPGMFLFMLLLLVSTASAQDIDQALGIDPAVNYQQLAQYGPWDDRNYQLQAEDLLLLAPNEAQLSIPIPAFYRVELRREFPHLRRTGPAQYPRAAVPLFYRRYQGVLRSGEFIEKSRQHDEGEASLAQRGLVNGEIKLNQVLNADEVTVEINPANPSQVIAGANNNGGQEMYYSTDGGENWFVQGVLANTCCDPTIDWKSDGSWAYTAALSGSLGVSFWRSSDGGQTWVDRLNLTNSGSDKEFLHVDRSPASPFQDTIYMTYHRANTMQLARSVNDGASFNIVAFSAAPKGIGSDITTTSNGDLYYFYASFEAPDIVLLKSTDGGNNFVPRISVTPTSAVFDFPIPAMEQRNAWVYAAADADRSGGPYDGSVYVAITDTTGPESATAANNHSVIEVWYSRDGGVSWNSSNPHSMADTATVDRFNHWLKVDELGNVHVVFYDTRHSVNRTGVDLYYNVSQDGGATWGTPQRVSSATSANLTDGQEWGDYNGLSVLGMKSIATWTDNRDGPPNSKDVYASDMDNAVAAPGFTLSGSNLQQQVCKPADLAAISVDVQPQPGFSGDVTLSTTSLPAGITGGFSVNPVSPPGSSVAQFSADGSTVNGSQGFTIKGVSGVLQRSLGVQLEVFDAIPATPAPLAPGNGAIDIDRAPLLDWSDVSDSGGYTVQLDDDPAFGSIDFSKDVALSEVQVPALDEAVTWYWRVRAANACGESAWSAVWSFATQAGPICSAPALAIPDGSGSVADVLPLGDLGQISGLTVGLDISHTFVGDLGATLTHEDSGTSVTLLDRPGVPASTNGCSGNHIQVVLDDAAATAAEDQCGNNPAIGGNQRPAGLLADFIGENSAGNWTLTLTDARAQNAGILNSWCLYAELDPGVPDSDGDGVLDDVDNCIAIANADQRDTNGDGHGNLCDGDLNNDCLVDNADVAVLRTVFFNTGPGLDGDFAGDEVVNVVDLGWLKTLLGSPPGPSAAGNCSP